MSDQYRKQNKMFEFSSISYFTSIDRMTLFNIEDIFFENSVAAITLGSHQHWSPFKK